ncbi:hypothetical protein B4065_1363 [Caldibacillus thermoamylovorans]|uniref:hypothetical protein n=1 Tax=Caldibacillus thermoamylovorans TaxID=35841 RepID=UPI0005B74F6B|nr:hypothetical protein [Caldibacillus thermoamylovorans]KIO69905.1 hypothetical protein B4065_1363 [Caldibacillus thermoamylovorans]
MKITESKKQHREPIFWEVVLSPFRKSDLPIVDVIPYKRITKDSFLIDKQNEFQAYLKVQTTDLVSLNNSDLNKVINQLTTICRLYTEDIKILAMTYSTETTDQQIYWKAKIAQYQKMLMSKNNREQYEIMLKIAKDNLRRVTWVEEQLSELTFFIIVYGKTEKEINSHIKEIIRLGGKTFNLQLVDRYNLENIVFRLNNINTNI